MSIGQSIVITGEITGEEDLVIAGRVEGRIHMIGCRLTLAPESRVKGDIEAERIVAGGRVEGRIVATGRLDVQATAAIQGELTTPSLQIADGAKVTGRVEMPARLRQAAVLPVAV
jgi:cytoskeletal protein CcmA (bactofilin family)